MSLMSGTMTSKIYLLKLVDLLPTCKQPSNHKNGKTKERTSDSCKVKKRKGNSVNSI